MKQKEKNSLRERVEAKIKKKKEACAACEHNNPTKFTPPRYDEMYFKNMEILNSNDDW